MNTTIKNIYGHVQRLTESPQNRTEGGNQLLWAQRSSSSTASYILTTADIYHWEAISIALVWGVFPS